MSCHHVRPEEDPVLVGEELQGISFQIFQKKSDTQESHMAKRKCFVVDQFLFSIEILTTHLYVPKYIVVICTTACTL